VSRILGAELLKLRTTRTAVAFLAATLGLVIVFLLISVLVGEQRDAPDSLSALDVSPGALFALIAAIVGVTGEYRHGTIASTFLAVPARRRQVAGQVLAYALAGALLIALSWLVQLLVGIPLLESQDAPQPEMGDLFSLIGREVLAGALLGGLGAGIGALVANQPAAIVGTLVAVLLVEPTLAALAPATDGYGPFRATANLAGDGSGPGPTQLGAAFVLAGWAAVLLLAGIAATERRDVGGAA
jgi:ABC-2 type transport system permease protein